MLIHTLFCCPFCASSPFTGLETSRNSYISLTFLVFSPFQAPGCADSHTMAGPHYLGVPRQPSSPREKGISATGGAVFGGLVSRVCEFTKTCHMSIMSLAGGESPQQALPDPQTLQAAFSRVYLG